MKKYKGLIALSCVVVLLIAMYIFLTAMPEKKVEEKLEYSVTEIYNFESESIKSMKFTSEQESYTLVFDGEKVFVEEIPDASLDEEKTKELRFSLSYMSTTDVIDENSSNLSDFGLVNPSYTLSVKTDSQEVNILVGDKLPGGGGYYCKTSTDNKVFVITNTVFSHIAVPLSEYRVTSFFEVDRESITDIALDINGKYNLVFKENVVADTETPHNVFNKYQMISPYNWPVAGDMIGKILDSVSQIEVVEYASENLNNMAEFGFSPYTAKLNFVHDGGKSDTIYFGNNVEGVIYIHVDGDERIYGVKYEPFAYLELEPFSYLSNLAFLRNIMTVKSISYMTDKIDTKFELKAIDDENVDVKKDGKLVSQDKFKDMYIELISVSVDGENTSENYKEPIVSYLFEYNDGTSEKVEFCEIDERRAALVVNGECQFYVNAVELKKKVELINSYINDL